MSRKPGPPPKGKRTQLTLRLPESHADLYRERSEALGYEYLSDYLAACLAEAHGLDAPPYLQANPEQPALPVAS